SGAGPPAPATAPARPAAPGAARWRCAAPRAAGSRGCSGRTRARRSASRRGGIAWSEPREEIELEDVGAVRRADDLVGAEPAHGERDAVGDEERAVSGEAFQVGAAEAEVLVVERIHHRVRLDVAVADPQLPV